MVSVASRPRVASLSLPFAMDVPGYPTYGGPFSGGIMGEYRRVVPSNMNLGGKLSPDLPYSGIIPDHPGRMTNGCIPVARVAIGCVKEKKNDGKEVYEVCENLENVLQGDVMWVANYGTKSGNIFASIGSASKYEENANQRAVLLSTHAVMARVAQSEYKVVLRRVNASGVVQTIAKGDYGYVDTSNGETETKLCTPSGAPVLTKWLLSKPDGGVKYSDDAATDGTPFDASKLSSLLRFYPDCPFMLSQPDVDYTGKAANVKDIVAPPDDSAIADLCKAITNSPEAEGIKKIVYPGYCSEPRHEAKTVVGAGTLAVNVLMKHLRDTDSEDKPSPMRYVPDGICKNIEGDIAMTVVSSGNAGLHQLQPYGRSNALFNIVVHGNVVTTTWSRGPFHPGEGATRTLDDGMRFSTRSLADLDVSDSLWVLLKATLKSEEDGGGITTQSLTNFRYFLTSSKEIFKRSDPTIRFAAAPSTSQWDKEVYNAACSLQKADTDEKGNLIHPEFIIGGYRIGRVIDSQAAPFDSQTSILNVTSPYLETKTSVEIQVDGQWRTGDQLATRFARKHYLAYVASGRDTGDALPVPEDRFKVHKRGTALVGTVPTAATAGSDGGIAASSFQSGDKRPPAALVTGAAPTSASPASSSLLPPPEQAAEASAPAKIPRRGSSSSVPR